MNGAQSLIRTLVDSGVDVCFMNPGTSEMHFVAALDQVPEMRSVLALFEGVATGAADGYARMADRPAATLLHLGPGLGNGLANLHNAHRGRTPIVNIVGDHATYHEQYDAPLQSDILTVARNVSSWIGVPRTPDEVAPAAAEAVAAAIGPPGQVATLILAADTAWLDAKGAAAPAPRRAPNEVAAATVADVAKVLQSGEPAALLLGGSAVRDERALTAAARVAHACGAKLLCETFPARLLRGAGIPPVERLGYLSEFAAAQMNGLRHLVLVDAKAPVSFFAYPEKPSYLVPDGCDVHPLAAPGDDAPHALDALADAVGAGAGTAPTAAASRPARPTGALTGETVAAAVGALLPENAVVVDEANTQGLWLSAATAGAPRHDWLCLTGGAIGFGLPAATGAAVASPDRKVVCLEADGSAMYTIQALWTQAREGLDVTTVILDNRSYAILNLELNRVGAEPPGPRAKAMLELAPPELDFVSIANGLGVRATRATTAEEFTTQLEAALQTDGPALVQAVLPSGLG
ncbi:MAG: thiamine pyrophosphate protein domain protein TPP-binding protein [Actinomycetia bacterium]|nr:thiamine pyrophosphate protein domain protein TPP-binding protein [Actinomycetes bacterium]